MSLMFLKPSPGTQVRDPVTMAHLPIEGRLCESSPYWLRRIRDGSVYEAFPEPVNAMPDPVPVVLEDEFPNIPESTPKKPNKSNKKGGR